MSDAHPDTIGSNSVRFGNLCKKGWSLLIKFITPRVPWVVYRPKSSKFPAMYRRPLYRLLQTVCTVEKVASLVSLHPETRETSLFFSSSSSIVFSLRFFSRFPYAISAMCNTRNASVSLETTFCLVSFSFSRPRVSASRYACHFPRRDKMSAVTPREMARRGCGSSRNLMDITRIPFLVVSSENVQSVTGVLGHTCDLNLPSVSCGILL